MKEPRRRHYLLFEPRNKIRLSISRTMSKKGLSFLEGRYPWSMPELRMKFPGRKRNERVGCRKGSTRELNECRELTVCTAALRIGWSTHIAWYCATLQNSRSWWSQHLHFWVALWKGWGSSQCWRSLTIISRRQLDQKIMRVCISYTHLYPNKSLNHILPSRKMQDVFLS